MQPSTDDLLIRQISALISATADAASPSKEYAPFMEARLYEMLAAHCAEKQRIAAIFAKSGFATAPRRIDLLVARRQQIDCRGSARESKADAAFFDRRYYCACTNSRSSTEAP